MAARADCSHCPFRDDPGTPCLALQRDDPYWCHATNRARAIWRRGNLDALRRATLEALGRPVPATFPPVARQARNLAGAVARAVASGLETASRKERERRLAICAECPEAVGGRCRRCGCFLAIKARVAAESCPLSPPKW